MPTIEPLSAASLDYLESFRLACVAVSPTGRVYVSHNPAGASMAWWLKADDCDKVAKAAWKSGDVPEAARRLQVPITPHAIVAQRVADRTAKIDEAIRNAVDAGVLKQFNQTYRELRLAKKIAGQSFMSYSEAQAKLRKAIAGMVAEGGVISSSFVAKVFEQIEGPGNVGAQEGSEMLADTSQAGDPRRDRSRRPGA